MRKNLLRNLIRNKSVMSKVNKAARYYVQQEVKGMVDHDISTGDMEEAFIAGVDWQKKRSIEAHKTLCPNHQNGNCTVFGKNKDMSDCWDTYADCDMKCKYMNGFINSL